MIYIKTGDNVMNKKNFLTIGELSRLTGTHIKSLRYYDSIGVLPPAYVDPVTSYRYYSHNQISLLVAIQLCIELDIPLKEFNQFISKDGNTIYIDKLYNHGKAIATEKIHQINKKLGTLEKFHNEVLRADSLSTEEIREHEFDNCIYKLVPFEGQQCDHEFNRILLQDIGCDTSAQSEEIQEVGLLRIFEGGSSKRFLFYSLGSDTTVDPHSHNTLFLPKGKYLCRLCQTGDIDRAEEIFPVVLERRAVVLEMELFSRNYNFTKPRYEISCYIFQ